MAKIVVMCLGYPVSFFLQLKDKHIGNQLVAGPTRKRYRFSKYIYAQNLTVSKVRMLDRIRHCENETSSSYWKKLSNFS